MWLRKGSDGAELNIQVEAFLKANGADEVGIGGTDKDLANGELSRIHSLGIVV